MVPQESPRLQRILTGLLLIVILVGAYWIGSEIVLGDVQATLADTELGAHDLISTSHRGDDAQPGSGNRFGALQRSIGFMQAMPGGAESRRSLEVLLVTESGAPFEAEDARVLVAASGSSAWQSYPVPGGRVSIDCVDALRLRVMAEGYQMVKLENVSSDEVVVMVEAQTLTVGVRWPLHLPSWVKPRVILRPTLEAGLPDQSLQALERSGTLLRHMEVGSKRDVYSDLQPMAQGWYELYLVFGPESDAERFNAMSPRLIQWKGEAKQEVFLKPNPEAFRQLLVRLNR